MSDGSAARVDRRSLENDAFRVVSARDSSVTRLRNLWNRRELLFSLIRSDIRIKYKNSALGIVWSMLTPSLFLAIYWLVFAKFLKNGIPNFVVYLFAGMVVWNMFNTSLSTATGVIVVRSGLVKKVSFPREILALANVGAATFYFFIQLCVFGLYLLRRAALAGLRVLLVAADRVPRAVLLHRRAGDTHVGDHGLHARHGALHPHHLAVVVLPLADRLLLRALHRAAAARPRAGVAVLLEPDHADHADVPTGLLRGHQCGLDDPDRRGAWSRRAAALEDPARRGRCRRTSTWTSRCSAS